MGPSDGVEPPGAAAGRKGRAFHVTGVTRRLSRVRTICRTFVGERGRTPHTLGRGRRPLSTVCSVDAISAAGVQRRGESRTATAAPVHADRFTPGATST